MSYCEIVAPCYNSCYYQESIRRTRTEMLAAKMTSVFVSSCLSQCWLWDCFITTLSDSSWLRKHLITHSLSFKASRTSYQNYISITESLSGQELTGSVQRKVRRLELRNNNKKNDQFLLGKREKDFALSH